jgi:hypothetical protein
VARLTALFLLVALCVGLLVAMAASVAHGATKRPLALPPAAQVVAYGVGHAFPTVCSTTSAWNWAGQTDFQGGTPTLVTLTATTCATLTAPITTRLSEGAVAFALLIALHEASHVALATGDEAQVNCRALTILPAALHALLPVAPAAVAARMVEDARESWWRMPDAYHLAGCAAAGVKP